jgi:hypothetical protein
MNRIEYANLATDILLGGLDRLKDTGDQIQVRNAQLKLETKIPL